MRTFLFSLMLIATFALSSCEEASESRDPDIIWDVCPLIIEMSVQDSDGKDLLSPSNENNITEDDIYVIYKDKTYRLGENVMEPNANVGAETRYYLAVLTGLQITKEGNDYMLEFGQFDGARDWDDSFEIYWGDGTKDRIAFQRDFEWAKDGSPKVVSSALYLNNQKMDKLVIVR